MEVNAIASGKDVVQEEPSVDGEIIICPKDCDDSVYRKSKAKPQQWLIGASN